MRKNIAFKVISALLMLSFLASALILPLSAIEYTAGKNKASESYKEGPFYQNLLNVPLTGDNRTDVVAVALSQLGYQESDKTGVFGGTVAGGNNFTEFNYNFGAYNDTDGYGYEWCASFVSFCLLQAKCHNQTKLSDWCRNHEGDKNYIWKELSCPKWASQLRKCGYFQNSASKYGSYIPIAGDLIFFTQNGNSESHIGIVLYSDGKTVYTIEGNTSAPAGLDTNGGGVFLKSYSFTSTYIMGYGVLPYKVNNTVARIDYSGENATPGLYVASKPKNIYSSADSTTPAATLPKYSQFTVLEVLDNGRVYAECTVGDKQITGYIDNNDDRIMQISSDEQPDGYVDAKTHWGYAAGDITSYTYGNSTITHKPTATPLLVGETLGANGWVGYTRSIAAFGYSIDGGEPVWSGNFMLAFDSAVTNAGGKNAKKYNITVPTEGVEAGKHTAALLVRLTDGSIAKLESIDFELIQEGIAAPSAPEILTFSSDSITLKGTDGFEYRLGNGEWQTSTVFTGLDKDTLYSFSQRIVATDTSDASFESATLDINIASLLKLIELTSLTVKEGEISPAFAPDTLEYSVKVPFVTSLQVDAKAAEGSTVTVGEYSFSDDNTATVSITVTSPLGVERVYTLNVTREAPPATDSESTSTDEPKENGCKAYLSLSMLAFTAVATFGCAINFKKNR